jgi:hypothetical protein
MSNILFQAIDWSQIEKVAYKGETGTAFWQTIQFSGLRIRLVEYSKDYMADHWCQKGHIVHCLEGSFVSELTTGDNYMLSKGMTYIVSDDLSSHRSVSVNGVKLLIIDGDFLKSK